MRTLLLFTLFFSILNAASAQTAAKIRLQNSAPGKITVIRNKTRAVVDLRKEVAGCAFATNETKKRFKDCAASAADFRLVDATVKEKQTYLLISADAAGNCNVCGRCGADDAFALVWVKLDKNLRLLDKKSVAIDFCLLDITLISDVVDFNEETQEQKLKLVFQNELLAIDFEKRNFVEDAAGAYEFSHLEYNRKTPEKGFVIKTEKRAKSSIPEQ